MGGVVGSIVDPIGIFGGGGGGGGGDDASDAIKDAADIQAQAQREALDYLKETEEMPQQFREGSLQKLAGMYGLEGGTGSQQEMIDMAQASPYYAAMMQTGKDGEEQVMRNASMTGGLRSGNTQHALYDQRQQLGANALYGAYNQQMQGLQGLAQLPSLAPAIAGGISGIGQTLGQGQIAAAQAQQAGQQNQSNNMMGLGQLGLQAFGLFA